MINIIYDNEDNEDIINSNDDIYDNNLFQITKDQYYHKYPTIDLQKLDIKKYTTVLPSIAMDDYKIDIKEIIEIHNKFIDDYYEIIKLYNNFVDRITSAFDNKIENQIHLEKIVDECKFNKAKFFDDKVLPQKEIINYLNIMYENMKNIKHFIFNVNTILSRIKLDDMDLVITNISNKIKEKINKIDRIYTQKIQTMIGGNKMSGRNKQFNKKLQILDKIFDELNIYNNVLIKFITTNNLIHTTFIITNKNQLKDQINFIKTQCKFFDHLKKQSVNQTKIITNLYDIIFNTKIISKKIQKKQILYSKENHDVIVNIVNIWNLNKQIIYYHLAKEFRFLL
jgi:hypothetical protein